MPGELVSKKTAISMETRLFLFEFYLNLFRKIVIRCNVLQTWVLIRFEACWYIVMCLILIPVRLISMWNIGSRLISREGTAPFHDPPGLSIALNYIKRRRAYTGYKLYWYYQYYFWRSVEHTCFEYVYVCRKNSINIVEALF